MIERMDWSEWQNSKQIHWPSFWMGISVGMSIQAILCIIYIIVIL